MKRFKPRAYFVPFVLSVLIMLSQTSSMSETMVSEKSSRPSAEDLLESIIDIDREVMAIPAMYDLYGTVIDATPDHPQESFAKLEQAVASSSEKEFGQTLGEMLVPRPAPNVVVTLRGRSVTREVVTDSQGKFKFIGLLGVTYELSAEMPSRFSLTGVQRKAAAKKQVRPDSNSYTVMLKLHADPVSVKGRITDVHGQPIAGAKVTGTLVPARETGPLDRVSTVSSADGTYELQGFVPVDIYHIAGYLNGGSLSAPGSLYTCVNIRVKADGFVHRKANVTTVPLITENLLVPARRFLKLMNLWANLWGGPDIREKEGIPLPSSQGNTITDIDIVLDRAGTAVQ